MSCSLKLLTELGKSSPKSKCHKTMQKHLVFVTTLLKFQDQMKAKQSGMQFPIYFVVCGQCIELAMLVTL